MMLVLSWATILVSMAFVSITLTKIQIWRRQNLPIHKAIRLSQLKVWAIIVLQLIPKHHTLSLALTSLVLVTTTSNTVTAMPI